MSDLKLPRLLAAAKEFNIGQDTLVDFLAGKGFKKDDLKPTAKLSEEMYVALQTQFQGDKVAKAKAELVDLPKGAEARKRREDEEISFKKEEKKQHSDNKEVINEIAPEPKAEEPKKEEVEEKLEVKEVVEEPKKEVAEVKVVEIKPEEPKKEIIEVIEVKPEEPKKEEAPIAETISNIEAPEITLPKVLDKIDLSTIDSSTRPKKGVKKKEETPKVEEKKPVEVDKKIKKEVNVEAKKIEPVIIPETIKPVEPEAPEAPVIENIQAERLTGPKILGKIQLPVDNDTRPKQDDREKRKRKRIPLDKNDNNNRPPQQGQGGGGGNRPPFQGGAGGNNRPPQQGGAGGNRPPYQGQGGNNRGPGGTPGGANRPSGPGGAGGANRSGGGGNRFGNRPGNALPPRREDKVIDEKEIKEKLKETQARLSGTNRQNKNIKAKLRRDKRKEMNDSMGESTGDNKLMVTEFISVSELANLMDVSFADVISKCMSLGIMVSINQRLDAEVIELVASEFDFNVEFIDMDKQAEMDEEEDDSELEDTDDRAPIVTIMGHVDHGKTSLLDHIRKANVVSGEAGGITQHIGAYEVTTNSGKKITFLDTPGHEAFTAMRARGAKVTDLAVIVIAADDAVMPQTKEAISHAQAANVPMIFAVNKIDKDGAKPEKIYEQLAQMNILVESWGGKFQSQELSARQGLNIDLLLEKILLEAELLELKANAEKEGTGTIIEATLDKGRGYVATVLVQNGTLKQGDIVVSGQNFGRVKAMFNERNERKTEAGPSVPVLILGLNGAPQAGEKFRVYEDEAEAKEIAYKRGQILREQGMRAKKHITLDEIGRRLALGNFKELNVIIKGDVDGSVEALSDSLQKLSTEEIVVKVILKAVGAVSENDVTLANASDAIIIGFNVRPNLQASKLAEAEGIEIKQYSIIYNAISDVKAAMEGMLEPKIQEKEVATVEIREVYKFDKATVAGCYVLDGKIKRDAKIRLFRDGILIYPRTEGAFAELGSLKRYKDDAKEVASNMECGLTLKNYTDLQVGDTLVAIEEEEVKRTL